MTFGNWDEATHSTLDALKRIRSANEIPPIRVLSVDQTDMVGRFYGSSGEIYDTCLDSCTCTDFLRRALPCKHIYRLAAELDFPVFDAIPEFNPYFAFEYDVEEDIQRLKARMCAGQLTFDAFIKCADALRASSAKAKKKPGRPKKNK